MVVIPLCRCTTTHRHTTTPTLQTNQTKPNQHGKFFAAGVIISRSYGEYLFVG
jgi:hypothetical protein